MVYMQKWSATFHLEAVRESLKGVLFHFFNGAANAISYCYPKGVARTNMSAWHQFEDLLIPCWKLSLGQFAAALLCKFLCRPSCRCFNALKLKLENSHLHPFLATLCLWQLHARTVNEVSAVHISEHTLSDALIRCRVFEDAAKAAKGDDHRRNEDWDDHLGTDWMQT